MPRRTLTDEEREHRRKKRVADLFARYKTSRGPRGSADQWKRAADAVLVQKSGFFEYLKIFGFDHLPTLEELRRSHRSLIKKAHPDVGGDLREAQKINEAYAKIMERLVGPRQRTKGLNR